MKMNKSGCKCSQRMEDKLHAVRSKGFRHFLTVYKMNHFKMLFSEAFGRAYDKYQKLSRTSKYKFRRMNPFLSDDSEIIKDALWNRQIVCKEMSENWKRGKSKIKTIKKKTCAPPPKCSLDVPTFPMDNYFDNKEKSEKQQSLLILESSSSMSSPVAAKARKQGLANHAKNPVQRQFPSIRKAKLEKKPQRAKNCSPIPQSLALTKNRRGNAVNQKQSSPETLARNKNQGGNNIDQALKHKDAFNQRQPNPETLGRNNYLSTKNLHRGLKEKNSWNQNSKHRSHVLTYDPLRDAFISSQTTDQQEDIFKLVCNPENFSLGTQSGVDGLNPRSKQEAARSRCGKKSLDRLNRANQSSSIAQRLTLTSRRRKNPEKLARCVKNIHQELKHKKASNQRNETLTYDPLRDAFISPQTSDQQVDVFKLQRKPANISLEIYRRIDRLNLPPKL